MFPRLFVLFGAPGSGKSTILRYLLRRPSLRVIVIAKESTREQRNDDGPEIRCVEEISVDCDIRYTQYGVQYGFRSSEVWEAFRAGSNVAIIVNDIRTIRILKKRFGSLARAVYIHSNVDPDRMYRLAEERHRGANIHQKVLLEDTMRRAEKIRTVHRKYVENTALFDHTILNLGLKKDLYGQLRNVLSDPSPLRVPSDSPVRIFVITGASYSGKDELVNAMKEMDRNVEVYQKVTTRPQLISDRSELRHVDNVDFTAFDVCYTMQGHVYGVSSLEIWNLLAGGRVALLVLSDRESIEKLVTRFGDVCTVIYVHANHEERDLRSRMSLAGVAADEIDKRMNMIQELFDLYVERTNLFDHVLLNTAEPEDLFDQAFNLLDHYVRLV